MKTITKEEANLINKFYPLDDARLVSPGELIDFDTIMQLVEKIDGLDEEYTFQMGYGVMANLGLRSKYAYCSIDDWRGTEISGSSGQPTLLECVYTTVIDFIKYYNRTKS